MSPELTKAMRSGEWGHMVAFRRAPGVLVCRENIKYGSFIMEEKRTLGLITFTLKQCQEGEDRFYSNGIVKPKVQV